MSNCAIFGTQEITSQVNIKHDKSLYKMMRNLGTSLNSALMCGYVEYLLIENGTDQLKQFLSVKPLKPHGNKFITIINSTLQSKSDKVKAFYEHLKNNDITNVLAGEFLYQDYFNYKRINPQPQEKMLAQLSNFWDVGIETQSPQKEYNFDIQASKNSSSRTLRFFRVTKFWYFLVPEPAQLRVTNMKPPSHQSQTTSRCIKCKQQIQKWILPGCGHYNCPECFKKYFSSQAQLGKCECGKTVYREQYNEFLKQEQEQPKKEKDYEVDSKHDQPSNQIKQIPAQQTDQCRKCFKQVIMGDLYKFSQECGHLICRPCLEITFAYRTALQTCPCSYCFKKAKYDEAQPLLGQKSDLQQSQMRQTQSQLQADQELPKRCEKCGQLYSKEEIYQNFCGHSLCKGCYLNYDLNRRTQGNPLCFSRICSEYFLVEDMRNYFEIQDFNKKCNKCLRTFEAGMLYKNLACGHYICFECIQKMVEEQQQQYLSRCPEKYCKFKLNQDAMEQFFITKQEEMFAKLTESQRIDSGIAEKQKPSAIQNSNSKYEVDGNLIQAQSAHNNEQPKQDQADLGGQQVEGVTENKPQSQVQGNGKIENQTASQSRFIQKGSSKLYSQSQSTLAQKNASQNQGEQSAANWMQLEGPKGEDLNNESIVQIVQQVSLGPKGPSECQYCQIPIDEFNILSLQCQKHSLGICCCHYTKCPICEVRALRIEDPPRDKFLITRYEDDTYETSKLYQSQFLSKDDDYQRPNSRFGQSQIFSGSHRQNSVAPSFTRGYRPTQWGGR